MVVTFYYHIFFLVLKNCCFYVIDDASIRKFLLDFRRGHFLRLYPSDCFFQEESQDLEESDARSHNLLSSVPFQPLRNSREELKAFVEIDIMMKEDGSIHEFSDFCFIPVDFTDKALVPFDDDVLS